MSNAQGKHNICQGKFGKDRARLCFEGLCDVSAAINREQLNLVLLSFLSSCFVSISVNKCDVRLEETLSRAVIGSCDRGVAVVV